MKEFECQHESKMINLPDAVQGKNVTMMMEEAI